MYLGKSNLTKKSDVPPKLTGAKFVRAITNSPATIGSVSSLLLFRIS